jgi:phosphatidylglycerophosphate synthase
LTKPDSTTGGPRLRFCFVGDAGPTLFGLSPVERSRRLLARAGAGGELPLAEASNQGGSVLVIRADAAIDQPLIPLLMATPGLALVGQSASGEAPLAILVPAASAEAAAHFLLGRSDAIAGLDIDSRRPSELKADFWKALRKRETPYAFAVSAANARDVEWRMFMGTYKGATDLVTKHVWPVPAFHATRFLAPRGVTPNMVTTIAAICTVLAFLLFLKGHFAAGLVFAWAMTFLDTVDGKLARTTLTSSKWGDIFDHGIDLVHPPFWYVAWALGLGVAGFVWSPVTFWWVIAAILGGYVVQRLFEGIAIKWLGLEIHIWRPVDTLFRQITARRNPNLVLLTLSVLIGRPDWGLIAVAVWTVVCLVLHALQLMQALAAKKRLGQLTSWMTGR